MYTADPVVFVFCSPPARKPVWIVEMLIASGRLATESYVLRLVHRVDAARRDTVSNTHTGLLLHFLSLASILV